MRLDQICILSALGRLFWHLMAFVSCHVTCTVCIFYDNLKHINAYYISWKAFPYADNSNIIVFPSAVFSVIPNQ